MKFDGDTTLAEILKDEEAQQILAEHEVPCLGCPMAKMEMEDLTLEQICNQYDLDLNQILKELNNERGG